MEDERSIANKDKILKKLVSNCEFEGDVYSSDDELDIPYENDEISDDIDELVFREQIRGAKNFFKEVTELDCDEDDLNEIVHDALDVDSNVTKDVVLKPSVKYSDALSYFEIAMERNSKMRDKLLALKQMLIKKKQEYEDMISVLELQDETTIEQIAEEDDDDIVHWGFPGYLKIKDGVVFTNKVGIFFNQFLPPYFKDKDKFHCPPNSDAIRQKEKFVSVSAIEPSKPWSPVSIENLETAIRKSLVSEFKDRADFKAIYKWREYSSFVNSHSLDEILKAKPSDFKFDWLKITALLHQGEMRTSAECSKLWSTYLSPKFCKDDWTVEENNQIVDLVKRYEEQDWDKVSSELPTSRSAFQIFSYYQASLRNKVHFGETWTHEEDEYVKNVVNSCTYGNYISWKKVMYYCEKRSYIQVYNRWQNNLAIAKKGKFSDKEDRALMTAIAHGMGYKDTSKAFGGKRSSQQIRDRVKDIVKFGRDNALNIGDWSVKEDTMLLELIQIHGEKWAIIAKKMMTRDRTQCRHRYNRLKEYKQKNPNFDIKLMDRRKRKGYAQKLRRKKRNLIKMLESGALTQKKKRTFLSEVNSILEHSLDKSSAGDSSSSSNVLCMPLIKYMIGQGSGFWSPFDPCKTFCTEHSYVADCCRVLGAKLNYDLYTTVSEQDEHLKPIRDLIPFFKENKVCDSSGLESESSDIASTSSGITYKKLNLFPPNQVTCKGFLQSLSFCSNKEKSKHYGFDNNDDESEEVKVAKDLFQQRLIQLFLWPAILANKDKKNKLNTYGANGVRFKFEFDLPKK